MNIRSYRPGDLNARIELTIATFRPFYEDHFRSLVGEVIFHHQHSRWADDYRAEVPALHDPAAGKYVAVAETGDRAIAGYVAWTVDPARRHGTDSFHAPAWALYESLGCIPCHVAVYFRQL